MQNQKLLKENLIPRLSRRSENQIPRVIKLKCPKKRDTVVPPPNVLTCTALPVVRGFHGLVVTSRVRVCGARQPPEELVVFDVLLFNERLGAFTELPLVPIMTVVSVHIFRDTTDRQASLFRKWIVVVVRAGGRTRVGRVDRGSTLSRSWLGGDHGVRTMTRFPQEWGGFSPGSWVEWW